MCALLECRNLSKSYGRGTLAESVLNDLSMEMAAGETYAIIGPSGSGKTTLLSILGCLLTPTAGEVRIEGERVNYAAQARLIELRRTRIGFVFQHAQLLPYLTVAENLHIVGRNGGVRERDLRVRMSELTKRLGIEDLVQKKPGQLSGGQRQRVAIARAVLNRPPILLADEPTAALDWRFGQATVQLLIEQAKLERALLIAVTHDTRLISMFDRVLSIESGRLRDYQP